MTCDPAQRTWIVLLEAADDRDGPALDPSDLDRLAAAWGNVAPTALYSSNRYALQASVRAADPPSALAAAIESWEEAVRASGVPGWDLVRAEVVTPEELEAELQSAGVPTPAPASRARTDPVGDDLLRRALHDRLTGLPDREIFLHFVGRALKAVAGHHVVLAVGLDPLGEAGGFGIDRVCDKVLLEVARRLSAAVRAADTVARVGPARFAVLAALGAEGDADRLARRVVAGVRLPARGDDSHGAFVISVGVATAANGGDADELMGMAETAMGAAREAGGNCHRRFGVRPGNL